LLRVASLSLLMVFLPFVRHSGARSEPGMTG
jgi:hypothetical protein